MPIGRLHVLTDYYFQQHRSQADLAACAIRGGADAIQFRQKHGGIRHVLAEARSVARVCASHGIPLLIDDHLDVMQAVGAHGVHLGQTDFPIAAARAILGDAAIIGATATTRAQALRAQDEGASYIGFGPVFPTRSKRNPASVKGVEGLADVCASVSIPVIAIAGITPPRVRTVLEAGAHGIAVMTAVSLAPDPEAAAARFRSAIEAYLKERSA